jgi:hypothetical protein
MLTLKGCDSIRSCVCLHFRPASHDCKLLHASLPRRPHLRPRPVRLRCGQPLPCMCPLWPRPALAARQPDPAAAIDAAPQRVPGQRPRTPSQSDEREQGRPTALWTLRRRRSCDVPARPRVPRGRVRGLRRPQAALLWWECALQALWESGPSLYI